MTLNSIELPIPDSWNRVERTKLLHLVSAISADPRADDQDDYSWLADSANETSFKAAVHILRDLKAQGWDIEVSNSSDTPRIVAMPPLLNTDPLLEKQRVRTQELIKRNEQLRTPSVQRFIAQMERPREFGGRFVSIFSLMRDGTELSNNLISLGGLSPNAETLRRAIDPYVQFVTSGERCAHTGLRLMDVWRYFRHTWSNQYTSTPGRTMMLLVRDRSADFHPVIGIAALGSPIIQIRERDHWIGWESKVFLDDLTRSPNLSAARWIVNQLEDSRKDLYLEDLIEDGLYWPTLWDKPSEDAVVRLLKESQTRRDDHHRFSRGSDLKGTPTNIASDGWRDRAEVDLFRSKRCLAIANLLRSRIALQQYLYPKPSKKGLALALNDPHGRRAIASVLRRAKSAAVGTEMADLTVCGAIAPYNSLLAGKLVAMLAVSPTVIKAYKARYSDYSSQIASSIAGRPVRRRTNLVFVGTTSLYGSGSSQYNRLGLPTNVLNNRTRIEFARLGMSRSYGTSHLSANTVRLLVQLAEQSSGGIRVNSVFGEGVNPKLRKVRQGLDLMGWPSDRLLQHGRKRIVYGVSLVENLLPYLLGIDQQPKYRFDPRIEDDVDKIADWWMSRWLSKRVDSLEVLQTVATHRTGRPVRHGARVVIDSATEDDGPPSLFELEQL